VNIKPETTINKGVIMILIIGLSMTVVSWIFQIFRTVIKKDPKLSKVFLALYAVGCVLLSVGNFLGNDVTGGTLNAFDVILPVTILTTLIVAKKTV
jgi:hypothetical protein